MRQNSFIFFKKLVLDLQISYNCYSRVGDSLKEAMWGVGILALCLFGLVLVTLFGDVTVTNQQDYTLMKNTVEAAMNDAVDLAAYRYGFCLCTKVSQVSGKYVFTDKSQYTLHDLVDGSCDHIVEQGTCEILMGETKINTEVFAESLLRRFGDTAKNSKDYQVIIHEVIEYPPKVSVTFKSNNTFNIFSNNSDEFNITNTMDSILEYKSKD